MRLGRGAVCYARVNARCLSERLDQIVTYVDQRTHQKVRRANQQTAPREVAGKEIVLCCNGRRIVQAAKLSVGLNCSEGVLDSKLAVAPVDFAKYRLTISTTRSLNVATAALPLSPTSVERRDLGFLQPLSRGSVASTPTFCQPPWPQAPTNANRVPPHHLQDEVVRHFNARIASKAAAVGADHRA